MPLEFEAAVRQLHALGFRHADVVALPERPAEHREALAETGLVVACAAVGRDLPDGCTLDAPDVRQRRAAVLSHGLPYIVAIVDCKLAGYAYATLYRPRIAYRFTIEDSIYIDDACRVRGVGRALLAELIARCEQGPWRQMIAVIADGGRGGSLSLHRNAGFELVGTLKAVGFKHGRWLDSTVMQRTLGQGSEALPADAETASD